MRGTLDNLQFQSRQFLNRPYAKLRANWGAGINRFGAREVPGLAQTKRDRTTPRTNQRVTLPGMARDITGNERAA